MSTASDSSKLKRIPYREVSLPDVGIDRQVRDDGTTVLKCADPLKPFDPNIVRSFLKTASAQPEKILYAQRQRLEAGKPGEWRHVCFGEATEQVKSIGQWLMNRGFGRRDALLIISGNSIAHALIRLGGLAAQVSTCPISANYALMGGAYERLQYVLKLIKPKVIFAETGGPYADALKACEQAGELGGAIIVTRSPDAFNLEAEVVGLDDVLNTRAEPGVLQSIEEGDPDEHAAYMLTSGSTGMPKAVIQTQRMLSTNLHQAFQKLGFASGWDDVMLDWLPWSHVSGAFNLMAAAVFGGSLYIDEGKPAPGLFEETLHNLRDVAVPYFCNVPSGFAMLVDALEQDQQLRSRFFSKLRMILYGGAGLPQPILDRLQKMAIEETGGRIFMTTGYGLTETASGCMAIYFDTDKAGIGLPLPGLEVKLVPAGDRYEVRLRGDNIMPGYLHNPESTKAAFDDEGFFRTGDAARFHDENDINQGLYFAGRLVEEFKLGTGTWVYSGQVRGRLIEALAPAVSDILLCGIGQNYLAALGVPSPAGLSQIAGGNPPADTADLLEHPKIRAFLQKALEKYNQAHPASSNRIRRFAFMAEPPNAARYELSDKGTLNQTIAAENRIAEIEALYSDQPGPRVLAV